MSCVLVASAAALWWLSANNWQINIESWREPLASRISQTLGREVWLRGAIGLSLSVRPSVTVDNLHIRNPDNAGFIDADWIYARQVRFALDVPAYFRTGKLRFTRLQISDLAVDLRHSTDGQPNWQFASQSSDRTEQTGADSGGPALVIDQIDVDGAYIEYRNRGQELRIFSLSQLRLNASSGQAMSVQMRGVADAMYPFSAQISGPSYQDMKASQWPLGVQLESLGATLTATGSASATGAQLQVALGAQEPSHVARLLQIEMPRVGPTALVAELKLAPGSAQFSQLRAWMGATQLDGELNIDWTKERPRIAGRLHVPELDLTPFTAIDAAPFAAPIAVSTEPAQSIADWFKQRSVGRLPLGFLQSVDAELDLVIDRWHGLPGNVQNADLQLSIANGVVHAPFNAQLAGITAHGLFDLDTRASMPALDFALGTVDTPLGEVARLLFGIEGVNGALGGIAIRIAGGGRTMAELANGLDVYLAVARGAFTYGNRAGQRPVRFGLDSLSMHIAPGQRLQASGSGSLIDQPLSIDIHGASLLDMLSKARVPIDIKARSRSVFARLHGTMAGGASTAQTDTRLRVDLRAKRARDAAAWLGLGANLAAPLSLGGRLSFDGRRWSVRRGRLALGSSGVRAELSQSRAGHQALVKASIVADSIDVDELQALFGRAQHDAGQPSARSATVLEIPILPANIDLTDTDLSLRVKRVIGSQLDVRDLEFRARVRNGRMSASPLKMAVLGVAMNGAIELDLRGQVPKGQWWLFANDVNIGRVLRRLNMANNIDAHAALLQLHLKASGARLGDMLRSSSLTVQLQDGEVALRDQNTGVAARIALRSASLSAQPGSALTGELHGSLRRQAINIRFVTADLKTLVDTRVPITFKSSAQVADTKVSVSGVLGRQFGQAQSGRRSELNLDMAVDGQRLDSLDVLLGVEMPPWGPYQLNSQLLISARGYQVTDLTLKLGDSEFVGRGSVFTHVEPPVFDLQLSAPRLQLADFKFGDWQPFGPANKKAGVNDGGGTDFRQQARAASERAQALLSPQVLQSLNGKLHIHVADVRSGPETIGRGDARIRLSNGKAVIGPVNVKLADGSASVTLDYHPGPDGIELRTRIDARQFDYGFLARRLKAESTLAGRLNLQADLRAQTPDLSRAMQHSSGEISLGVWPVGVQADVFDLWATNLLIALATQVDPENSSLINCGRAHFSINKGLMSLRDMSIDTTRVRVQGEGVLNFGDEAIALRLTPTPKRAEFFSLATPLSVSGSFDDYQITPSAGDVLATAVRLATSLIWVPAQKLFGRAIPANGADICGSKTLGLTAQGGVDSLLDGAAQTGSRAKTPDTRAKQAGDNGADPISPTQPSAADIVAPVEEYDPSTDPYLF